MISEKNILETVRAKKILQGNNCHTMACMSGKKLYHQRFEEKKFLHKANHPHFLQKSNGRPVNEL